MLMEAHKQLPLFFPHLIFGNFGWPDGGRRFFPFFCHQTRYFALLTDSPTTSVLPSSTYTSTPKCKYTVAGRTSECKSNIGRSEDSDLESTESKRYEISNCALCVIRAMEIDTECSEHHPQKKLRGLA